MYIAVQKHTMNHTREGEKPTSDAEVGGEIMAQLSALQDASQLVPPDVRAARQLGYDPAEYGWVKDRVLEVRLSILAPEMQLGTLGLESLRGLQEQTSDPDVRARLDEQIARAEKRLRESDSGMSATASTEEALSHNRRLLSAYEDELKVQ
jgi:hypothetical protein